MLSKLSKQPKSEKKPNSQKKEVALKWRTTFSNALPEVPSDPKFLPFGKPNFERMALFNNNGMAKFSSQGLDFGPLMGIRIETTDTDIYKVDTMNPPQMHPSDKYLLEDENLQKKGADKRARAHKQAVSFMRKSVVHPSFKPMGVNKQRTETTIGYGLKKAGVNLDEALYRNRLEQVEAIEKTFDDVKNPVRNHYQKEGVTAVEEFQLLPDIVNYVHDFVECDFDKDPTPLSIDEKMRKLTLENSQIYGTSMPGVDKKERVGHFIPTDKTLQRLLEEQERESEEKQENMSALEYTLHRDYSINFRDVQQGFYFRNNGDNFVYSPISGRYAATRIRRKAGEKMHPWSLELTRIEPTAEEFSKRWGRVQQRLGILPEEPSPSPGDTPLSTSSSDSDDSSSQSSGKSATPVTAVTKTSVDVKPEPMNKGYPATDDYKTQPKQVKMEPASP